MYADGATSPSVDDFERRLLNRLQDGLTLTSQPFAAIAAEFNVDEATVIATVQQLLAAGWLTRFGPMYRIDKAGGEFVLAAMSVPQPRFDEVTDIVNAFPEVAHNYEREHTYNMWFVVAAESSAAASAVLANIEAKTGLPVLRLPKEKEFYVDLRFYV